VSTPTGSAPETSSRHHRWVDSLTGWCVAVTAQRRAEEQAQLLTALGAKVLPTQLVTASPCSEDVLRARTEALIAQPPDIFVANTAVGMRSWLALAWSWGLGEGLRGVLGESEVVARGTKAAGALLSEDVTVAWRSADEVLDDVGRHLLAQGVEGRRIALQLDGRGDAGLVTQLRAAGAEVVEVPVYKVDADESGPGAKRLATALANGDVDAVTFTTPAAVDAYVELVGPAAVLHVCVGPVTAAAAGRHGLPSVIAPDRGRLGPMVRVLARAMDERVRVVQLAGYEVRVQGRCLVIGDDRVKPLTPRDLRLLDALIDAGGSVVSKPALAAVAWTDEVDDHAVEVAVNRLRGKLGPAAVALETSNRRGYRLAAGRPPGHLRLTAG
jgi:uroporphyrinogen-III synthase